MIDQSSLVKKEWVTCKEAAAAFGREGSVLRRHAKAGKIRRMTPEGESIPLYNVEDLENLYGALACVVTIEKQEKEPETIERMTTNKAGEIKEVIREPIKKAATPRTKIIEVERGEIDIEKIKNILEVTDEEAARMESVIKTFTRNDLSTLEVYERAMKQMKANRREEEKYINVEDFAKNVRSYFLTFHDSMKKLFSRIHLELKLSSKELAYMETEFYKEMRKIREQLRKDGYDN